jgi:hypothetical protein
MKKSFVFASGLMALCAVMLLGADIDGKWSRETQGKNGPQTQTLTLKAEGGKLTGNMEGGGGRGGAGAAEITEGTITGSDVAFKIVRDFGGQSITQSFKGTVSATELKLTQEVVGGPGGGAGGGKGFGGGGKGGPQEMVFKKN